MIYLVVTEDNQLVAVFASAQDAGEWVGDCKHYRIVAHRTPYPNFKHERSF